MHQKLRRQLIRRVQITKQHDTNGLQFRGHAGAVENAETNAAPTCRKKGSKKACFGVNRKTSGWIELNGVGILMKIQSKMAKMNPVPSIHPSLESHHPDLGQFGSCEHALSSPPRPNMAR
ncbi:hypothetical protein T265_08459 [Opisthorchis viverrini]|uniref:Uncharacterized protein n=1 Tax=Opisthorchis viverrini TaxID=6198 RepID=A0A074ZDP0_OPIVI|nr:hypothetical protein T265_08459 [Opisthorchis viverrini]KER23737.1 hypothetical protein T265_08459 [Opisthorchis viverrini]